MMRLAAIAAGVVIASAIVGVSVGAGAAPAAPTANHGALIANVTQSPVGWVPPGFVGVSFELRDIETYTGSDPTAINPMLEQLIRNLAPDQQPVIRIGGHSSDRTWYPIPNVPTPSGVGYVLTPTWLAVVKALAEGVDGRLIFGSTSSRTALRSPWQRRTRLWRESANHGLPPSRSATNPISTRSSIGMSGTGSITPGARPAGALGLQQRLRRNRERSSTGAARGAGCGDRIVAWWDRDSFCRASPGCESRPHICTGQGAARRR